MKMSHFSLKERYYQAMVLSGSGDALGYNNGNWEFCHSGRAIYNEMKELGGLENILVRRPKRMVSDDTVMHLATAEALLSHSGQPDKEKLFAAIAEAYKKSMHDMAGRAPGYTCMDSAYHLKPLRPHGYRIKFNPRGGGCGAAMRSMCIGLRYPRPEQREDLIAVSVESGRMTHHHPTGFLGSLAGALFTAYAVEGRPVISWGHGLLDTLPQALDYIKSNGYCVKENVENWDYFTKQWQKYLELRNLKDGKTPPTFPAKFDFEERDAFVKSVSFSGWGGSSGHDAPMIAYDALLGADGSWHELCNRAMFHAGDSDSTGVMAACWFGVMYGTEGVPEMNYRYVEYKERLEKVGKGLYDLAFPHDVENNDKMTPEEKILRIDNSMTEINEEPEECPFTSNEAQSALKEGQANSENDVRKEDQVNSENDITKEQQASSENDITKEQQASSENDITKEQQAISENDVTKEGQASSENDVTKEDQVNSENDVTKEEQDKSENDITKEQQASSENDITKEQQACSEKDITKEEQASSENDITKEQQARSENDVTKEQQARSENDITKEQHASIENDITKEQQASSEKDVTKEQQASSEKYVTKEEQAISENDVTKE